MLAWYHQRQGGDRVANEDVVQSVLDAIDAGITGDIRAEALACAVNYSAHHLRRVF